MPKNDCKVIETELICPECSNFNKIFRKKDSKRSFFHIKDLYCPFCQKVTKQIEIHDRNLARMELESYEELTEEGEYLLTLLDRHDENMKSGKSR